jgi:hypothetical protein
VRGRVAQGRPCRLQPAPLREIADWVEHDRRLWEVRFDRLESAPHEPPAKEKKAARKKKSPKE